MHALSQKGSGEKDLSKPRCWSREQTWKSGELITDYLDSIEGYGHLQWENSAEAGGPDPDWVNPYPDNYEPVKREGCDMFHLHGYEFPAYLYENRIVATMNCYILKDLEAWKNPAEINLITDAHVATFFDEVDAIDGGFEAECERLEKTPFNPDQARKKRLEFLESYSKVIGVTIPYDPRFID